MDAFLLKRKVQDANSHDNAKKTCKEKCPHAAKCYRRNPHHFKEFDHPHLDALLEKGEFLELPPDYPQDKQVVKEQLEVLRGLRNVKPKLEQVASAKEHVEERPSSSSVSKVGDKRLSSRNKSTSYTAQTSSTVSNKSSNMKPMAERLKENGPYNLFFTTIPDAPQTHTQQNSITFTDLLCPSLGELKCSLQINFMIDIAWLMEQYLKAGQGKKPLTILYGDEWPDMKKYIELMLPNVTEHLVKIKDPFGIHHSKVGIYVYSDNSLRVVVSTANLYYEDWNYYCQGLWISPLCPVLPEDSPDKAGESPTNFKSTLLSYLQQYNIGVLKTWIDYVKRADFSNVKVFLITSVPGKYTSVGKPVHCHLHSVGELLSHHCVLPAKTTPTSEGPLSWGVLAQSSSIGSLGKVPAEWLRGTLLRSLASHKDCRLPANSNSTLSIIFPTKDNVLSSYYGPQGGGCLPYSKSVHEKQKWLKDYLHQWKADHTNRSRAMPHIKTYCRVSPCTTKLAWFLITSANISKSAWGGNITKAGTSYVRSYEVGVLFLPKYFEETYFQIKDTGDDTKLFPFIYDIPLTPYKNADEPWCN
ncbi:hypothetical protein ILUMI_22058 [Ignelater luminosus]|uniref:PBZ-type domain-containing protein n=1 Tax=Ignelater luminosus TaxID=2038154 RepID=A0A8K0CAU0_IGNLU|nr:hypothetical protein ILUMI_22058 [Ignelater luminosus]